MPEPTTPTPPEQLSGEQPYHGQERRKHEPSVIVEQHTSSNGYKDMSVWQRAWANFGALGVGAMMLVSFFVFFQGMYKDEIQDRRSRDAEDREIRRAEVAQQDRRADTMTGELRTMRLSFEAVASSIRSSNTELRATREKMDLLLREMKTMLDSIVNATKKIALTMFPCTV